ncbi:MAG TPA: hypothetical protein VM802_19745 [Chitinophaga sp.]|uniref:hypothetical protein n=1 Tax=Chitinophaga sp. TaxID=1869181 RepID=UPI002C6E3BE3|nr:hypothetical protein [Chitinophaga sp.]HVI47120.1 hypothetical protein [Chitinophaga sp.]
MKSRISISLLGLFMLLAFHKGWAQQNNDAEIAILVQRMKAAYKSRPLSFDVRYTYSNELTPNILLDSLNGKVYMNGSDYRYQFDGTETVHIKDYHILIFREDKLLYLGKAVQDTVSESPLQQLLDALHQQGIRSCDLIRDKQYTTIRMIFQEGLLYRRLEMRVENNSGLLSQVKYLVKTSMLASPGTNPDGQKDYEEYASVVADFYHYQLLLVGNTLFDEHHFFVRSGNMVSLAPAYKDYKIFIATPNF